MELIVRYAVHGSVPNCVGITLKSKRKRFIFNALKFNVIDIELSVARLIIR